MTLHLVKLAVGIDDPEHLAEVQARLISEDRKHGGEGRLRHFTRNKPRKTEEVLNGGSLYRVIKGVILVRQRIISIEPAERPDGRPACALHLDPILIRTRPKPMRAFQGWRYLRPDDAPRDMDRHSTRGGMELPPEMAAELRELGLL